MGPCRQKTCPRTSTTTPGSLPATPRSSASAPAGSGRWSSRTSSPCCPGCAGGGCSTWAAAPGSWRTSWRKRERPHPRVTYRLESMESLAFPEASFDLVVSSLAFHYVRDYRGLVARIAAWLAPGGLLVFSTEHPIYTARRMGDGGDAWVKDAGGARLAWALDDYAAEGRRETRWFVPGVVRYHRTFATLVNGLLDAGMTLQRV